jgi:hypothetical protein
VPLLTALFGTAMIMGLGLSLVLMGSAETTLARRDRDARSLARAASAAATLAVADLRALPSWAAILQPGTPPELSATPGRLAPATMTPVRPWGGVMDLRGVSLRIQAGTDADALPGDPARWRLYGAASLASVVPADAGGNSSFLAVWVADDAVDGDGDPSADKNGVILVRGAAFGPGEGEAFVTLTISRDPAAGNPAFVRILTIRPGG